MSKANRRRIDYMPGPAAQAALDAAAKSHRNFTTQTLLDKLVIVAVSALTHQHWQPPPLLGRNRDRWCLPGPLQGTKGPEHG